MRELGKLDLGGLREDYSRRNEDVEIRDAIANKLLVYGLILRWLPICRIILFSIVINDLGK